VITDFHRSEIDVIDLSTIDADTTWSGNQSFTYIGGNAFSGEAGELNFRSGIISGDVNGDGYADFQIRVNGHEPAGRRLLPLIAGRNGNRCEKSGCAVQYSTPALIFMISVCANPGMRLK